MFRRHGWIFVTKWRWTNVDAWKVFQKDQKWLSRNADLARLQKEDVEHFAQLLGPKGILTQVSELTKYNRDWLGHREGQSKLVLFPKSTLDVAEIMKHCHRRRLAVVPQGGNTGLVEGSVPIYDEIILSTQKMNQILSFDNVSGVISCQAGCILESLEQHVTEKGFCIPLDLTPKGSCHIGGNLSTHAGGIRLLRYGSLHGTVLGMEAVLSDGEVLDMMSTLRKDNTGYDLKQLLIGSEGTLGVITKVALQCSPLSRAQNVCLLAVSNWKQVLDVVQRAKESLGEILSALEFMDAESYRLPFQYFSDLKNPLPQNPSSFFLLVETLGSNNDHDRSKLNTFIENVLEDGSVMDGVLAQDFVQIQNMWKIRECVATSLPLRGSVYKYDLSLPLESMYDLVEEMRKRLKDLDCLVLGFGHLGDGNLHLNISSQVKSRSPSIMNQIEPYVFERTAAFCGSISAEHGLGASKAKHILYSKSPSAVRWMKKMKQLFDPLGILNPYKVLPNDI